MFERDEKTGAVRLRGQYFPCLSLSCRRMVFVAVGDEVPAVCPWCRSELLKPRRGLGFEGRRLR